MRGWLEVLNYGGGFCSTVRRWRWERLIDWLLIAPPFHMVSLHRFYSYLTCRHLLTIEMAASICFINFDLEPEIWLTVHGHGAQPQRSRPFSIIPPAFQCIVWGCLRWIGQKPFLKLATHKVDLKLCTEMLEEWSQIAIFFTKSTPNFFFHKIGQLFLNIVSKTS